MVYACFCALLVVPLLFLIGFYARGWSYPWTASRVRWLAVAAGFLTGALSVSFPALMDLLFSAGGGFEMAVGMLLFSLVPGVIGLAGTLLGLEPLARRAGRETAHREAMLATAAAAPLPAPALTN